METANRGGSGLSLKSPDSHINVKVEFGAGEGKVALNRIAERASKHQPAPKVIYKMIQEYVEEEYGFKVHSSYITEVKRDLGVKMGDAPNAVEKLRNPRKSPTPVQVNVIKDALEKFGVINDRYKSEEADAYYWVI